MMKCPICGGETKVIDSRPDDESVTRRRICNECKYRFKTIEIDEDMLDILKNDEGKAKREMANIISFVLSYCTARGWKIEDIL